MVVGLSVPFVFLSAGVIVGIAFVVVKNYEKMKRCLQPPVRMPLHLKEVGTNILVAYTIALCSSLPC